MQPGDNVVPDPVHKETRERKPWVEPRVEDLPKLTDLTLLTGSPIGGGGNTGTGSTVF